MPINFLLDIFVDSMGGVLQSFGQFLALVSNLSFTISSSTLNEPMVVEIVRYVQIIATALLGIKMGYEAIQTYMLGRANDPDQSPHWIIINAAIATALIWSIPALIGFMADFGAKVMADLASLNIADFADFQNQIGGALTLPGNIPLVDALVYIFLFIGLFITMIIAMFQLLVRGLEIVVLAIIGPIIAINVASQNRSLFTLWCKQVFCLIGTQFIQLFILYLAISHMLMENTFGATVHLLLTFLWSTLALSAPKAVQVFMIDSGGANSGMKGMAGAYGAAMRG